MIIYKQSGTDPNCKLGHEIRQIIERKNDFMRKAESAAGVLFCREIGNGKKAFEAVCHNDLESYPEHVKLEKEFTIPQKWIEKSLCGDLCETKEAIDNIRRRSERILCLYYRFARSMLETALANATAPQTCYEGFVLNLCTPDGEPLFSENHFFGDTGRQSNLLKGSFLGDEKKTSASLDFLAGKLADMKDEYGEPLRYVADTIIIPSNRTDLYLKFIRAIAAQDKCKWNLVILDWRSDDDRFMIMSSDANRELGGNIFFNQVPLVVTSWTDQYTGNYIVDSSCRFNVKFGTYKHILLAIDTASEGTI